MRRIIDRILDRAVQEPFERNCESVFMRLYAKATAPSHIQEHPAQDAASHTYRGDTKPRERAERDRCAANSDLQFDAHAARQFAIARGKNPHTLIVQIRNQLAVSKAAYQRAVTLTGAAQREAIHKAQDAERRAVLHMARLDEGGHLKAFQASLLEAS